MAENSQSLWRNPLTYLGSAITALALLFIMSFLFFDLVTPEPNPYLGVLTFLILPAFLIIGGVLAVTGLLIARIASVRQTNGGTGELEYFPHINLNLADHRRILAGVAGFMAVAVPFVAFMTYEGYHYTDSNAFCGQVCHKVMQSQYVAHKQSPHSRVECATCHIGRGASWYVKAKLTGLRQVMAVARDSYPRPIPSAIKELRPARETCERCHWPQKFYGDQLVTINHHAADKDNTPRPIRMLMKTGGNDPTTGPPGGVHWHMALGHSIEFIATDDALQEIPWVRATDHTTNAQRVYRSDGLTGKDPAPEGELRLMDCMSCHNRATHIFREPWRAADDALNADPALTSLPFAKREVVTAVTADYPSKEQGLHEVATRIEDFYLINYPELTKTQRHVLNRLIAAARNIYNLISFPEMNITWRTYPDNIGHKNFPGCFRCHEGKHVDSKNRKISHECAICHTFLTPVGEEGPDSLIRAGGFAHPVELEGKHAELRCDFCHTGGMSPDRDCEGCHTVQSAFRAGDLEAFAAFDVEEDTMEGLVYCEDCHDLSKPTKAAAIDALCVDCHDDPEYEGMAEAWAAEVAQLLDQASAAAGSAEQLAVIEALRKAGPLHNMEATRTILTSLAGETTASKAPAASQPAAETEEHATEDGAL